MIHPSCSRRPGLTLVETVVVVAIIGVLAGLIAPAAIRVHRMYLRVQCANNLEQIGQGFFTYLNYKGAYPDAALLPSAQPNTPSLPEVFGKARCVDRESSAWRCPADDRYWQKEGLSYEYPAPRFAKLTIDDVQSRGPGRPLRRLATLRLMYDFDYFHGPQDTVHNRNVLYADYHVEDVDPPS